MWKSEWNDLSARISSLLDAGAFLFRTGENDNFNIAEVITRNAGEIAFTLRAYLNNYGTQLPNTAALSLSRFINEFNARFAPFETSGGLPAVAGVLAMLTSFRSEFGYLLANREAVARSLVTRAFLHLQRSIVADESVRQRWQKSFEDGETACEKLGSCHLLAHGIWAFKAYSPGERTDLVLGTPLNVTAEVERAAEALVLTEWKKVLSAGEASDKAEQAHAQAKRYGAGSLAGFELSSVRYLVLVSSKHLKVPEAKQEGEIRYEYINVAVAPGTPSAG